MKSWYLPGGRQWSNFQHLTKRNNESTEENTNLQEDILASFPSVLHFGRPARSEVNPSQPRKARNRGTMRTKEATRSQDPTRQQPAPRQPLSRAVPGRDRRAYSLYPRLQSWRTARRCCSFGSQIDEWPPQGKVAWELGWIAREKKKIGNREKWRLESRVVAEPQDPEMFSGFYVVCGNWVKKPCGLRRRFCYKNWIDWLFIIEKLFLTKLWWKSQTDPSKNLDFLKCP